ncbi:MAG: hypothetical protein ACYTGH_13670, partial [Planctomycetota bacterium]
MDDKGREAPREHFRLIRHLAVTGVVMLSLFAVVPLLAIQLQVGLTVEEGWTVPWCFLIAPLGMLTSWLLRKRGGTFWRNMVVLAASSQLVYWGVLALNQVLTPLTAGCSAWAVYLLSLTFIARGVRTFNMLHVLALSLLLVGGYQQASAHYSVIMGMALGLLVVSWLTERVSPIGIADHYVDTRYPGVVHLGLRALILILAVLLVAIPLYHILPRPTEKQREFLRLAIPRPRAGEVQGWGHADQEAASLHQERMEILALSLPAAPRYEGKPLFAVQGEYGPRWRSLVFDHYDGRRWSNRPGQKLSLIRRGHGRREVPLRGEDGARMGRREERYEGEIQVLDRIGNALVR